MGTRWEEDLHFTVYLPDLKTVNQAYVIVLIEALSRGNGKKRQEAKVFETRTGSSFQSAVVCGACRDTEMMSSRYLDTGA